MGIASSRISQNPQDPRGIHPLCLVGQPRTLRAASRTFHWLVTLRPSPTAEVLQYTDTRRWRDTWTSICAVQS